MIIPNSTANLNPAKKARLQSLMSAELKFQIPIDRAIFGLPVDLGNGETFVTMRTDPSFDERFSRPDMGITYTRLDLQTYLTAHGVMVALTTLPISTSTVVEMINAQVPIPLDASDYLNVVLEDPTMLTIPLQSAPESLLFVGNAEIALSVSIQKPLLMATSVGTFPLYTP